MASNSIKGLTVKIGADTSDFIKGLKSVDKEINQTQKTANELQKGLKLDYNEKNFLQAQKQIQKALETTEEKAKAIRQQMQKLEESGNVDTENYSKLETELAKTETKASQLKEQLEEINKIKLESVYKGAENLSKGLETAAKETAIFSAAAVAAIAGINKLGTDAAAKGGEIQDFADRLGISAESIQRYNYIALQSGVETEQLVKSIAKSRDAIGTAMSGTVNTATKALQVLFGDLSAIPQNTEDGFAAIIEQLSKVEDSTLQAYYANEIFGERLATNLIPLINNGADRLNQLNAEFETIGYLSNEQVQSLADFDDELNIMRERMELAKTEMGIALIPIMERFVSLLENKLIPAIQYLTDKFNELSPEVQDFITYGLLAVAALSPMLLVLSKIVGVFPTLIKGFSGLKTAFDSISKHPIILILGVIAAVLILLYTRNEEFRESVNKLLDLLMRSAMPILKLVQSSLEDIFTLLGPIIELLGNQLAPIIEFICVLLEPVINILEYIFQLIGAINDGILTLLGKGWLWGKGENSVELKHTEEKTETNTDINSILGNYKLPDVSTGNSNYSTSTNNYVDNSNVVVNIEKNEYMTEDDIIRAVNKGLKQAKQSRT